jgi:hypothetical protein
MVEIDFSLPGLNNEPKWGLKFTWDSEKQGGSSPPDDYLYRAYIAVRNHIDEKILKDLNPEHKSRFDDLIELAEIARANLHQIED